MTRVATWNLWWRHGDHEARQTPIITHLRAVDADVVALQEVSTRDPDQPARLRDEFGYHVVVSPDGDHDRTGIANAIASRWTIIESGWKYLDVGDMVPHRTVLWATIDAPTGPLEVICTHLSHGLDQSALRERQLAEVAHLIADRRSTATDTFPPVLMGDFNAVPDSDEIRRLTGHAAAYVPGFVATDIWSQVGHGPGATYSADNPYVNGSAWPDRRLDYIAVGWPRPRPIGNPQSVRLFGVEPVDGVVASDHYGVVGDLIT